MVSTRRMRGFFISEALGVGWKTFRANWTFLLLLMVVLAAINFVPGIVVSYLPANLSVVATIINVVFWVVTLVTGVGTIKITLDLVDGRSGNLLDLVAPWRRIFLYALTAILVGIVVVVGLILFVVPGLVAIIRLQFWAYLVVDQGMGPVEAIKKSWNMTAGVGWDLVGLMAVLLVVNLIGAIALGVGLLVTLPVTMIAMAYAYRQLSERG